MPSNLFWGPCIFYATVSAPPRLVAGRAPVRCALVPTGTLSLTASSEVPPTMRSRPRFVPRGSCPVRPRLRFASDRVDVIHAYGRTGRLPHLRRRSRPGRGGRPRHQRKRRVGRPISCVHLIPDPPADGAACRRYGDASCDFLLFARVRAYSCGVHPARMAGDAARLGLHRGGLAFMAEFHADPRCHSCRYENWKKLPGKQAVRRDVQTPVGARPVRIQQAKRMKVPEATVTFPPERRRA
jgi:hypothetical protein